MYCTNAFGVNTIDIVMYPYEGNVLKEFAYNLHNWVMLLCILCIPAADKSVIG